MHNTPRKRYDYSGFTMDEMLAELKRLSQEIKALERVKETERKLRLKFENELKRIEENDDRKGA